MNTRIIFFFDNYLWAYIYVLIFIKYINNVLVHLINLLLSKSIKSKEIIYNIIGIKYRKTTHHLCTKTSSKK